MRKSEKNAIILFFIFIFSLSSLCSIKVWKKNTKENVCAIGNKETEYSDTSENTTLKNKDSLVKKGNDQLIEKSKEKEIKPLKVGCRGYEVKSLQTTLNKFGYKINADGIFGASTEIAIYDFQKRNGLNRDGIAGESTIKKLELEPTEKTSYNPKDDIFSPLSSSNYFENFINKRNSNSSTDYYIWVNTHTPKVYIFKGFVNHWRLIKTMSCTVGRSSSPTIKGTFKVGNKGEVFVVKNNPNLICKYFTQISGNYLFHTVLLNRNGSIANGTLGAKISHGCIRLSIENAKYIYYDIPKGTTIYIN